MDTLDVGDETLPGDPPPAIETAPAAPPGLERTLPSEPGTPRPGRGMQLGRYLLVSRLGAGAMGVVYAAYDPELDRKIALKLILPGATGAAGVQARARLLREAQALARLAHPNVVAIHDVGTVDDQVWLAMELVDGETLGERLKAKPRWSTLLDLMIGAGRGLAAAHAAGLLHRDFKPENVMIGVDGRVRVMDLGLARARDADDSREAVSGVETTQAPRAAMGLATPVTRADALVGTPAYMAPEQFRGTDVTAAADQFAYCVTLWEGLFGERPFAGSNPMELAANVLEGRRRPPASGRRVPRWLVRVCERGLSVDPSRRWASMEELLDALVRGRGRARRRGWMLAAAVPVLLGGAFIGQQAHQTHQRVLACQAEGSGIDEVWNDAARQRVREAVLAAGGPTAVTTVDKLIPRIDAAAEDWAQHRTDACMNARVDGAFDASLEQRARWCLEDRRLGLEALVAELESSDASMARDALIVTSNLDPVEPCLDPAVLRALPEPPPDEARDAHLELRRRLHRSRTLSAAGEYEAALAVSESAMELADDLDWPPLVAESLRDHAKLLDLTGEYASAAKMSERAYMEAAQARAWGVAADAACDLILVFGARLGEIERARTWMGLARVAISLAGDPLELRTASRSSNSAHVEVAAGDWKAAHENTSAALAIFQERLGDAHPAVASELQNLAVISSGLGEYAESRRLYERALEVQERALGPEHPRVASIMHNLGTSLHGAGEYDQALALHERALEINERVLGPKHPDVSWSLTNVAGTRHALGDSERAERLLERAIRINDEVLPPAHRRHTYTLSEMAAVRSDQGDYEGAREMYRRILAAREKSLGSDHPDVASAVDNLAIVTHHLREWEEAERLYARSLRLHEKSLGPDHPDLAHPLFGLAQIAIHNEDYSRGVELAERVVALRTTHDVSAAERGEAIFLLAQALWREGRDRSRAVDLARRAAADFAAAKDADEVDEIEQWLAAHE